MNKFFDYYNSLCIGDNTPSVFSFDPYVTSMKQLMLVELQNIVFYIEKLKDLNIDMSSYTDKVIEFISVLIVNLDFKKESFFIIVKDLFENRLKLEKMYVSTSRTLNFIPELLNVGYDLSTNELILKALNKIEKDIQKKSYSIQIDKDKKNLYEIMINLVLNSCNCLIELKSFNVDLKTAKNEVLKLLNSTNLPALSDDDLIKLVKDFSKCNYYIMKKLYKQIIEKYGPVKKTDVSNFYKEGRAILVSGNSLKDLEKILLATEDLNINVYTHDNMICAFQYEKFSEFKNLVGHYQQTFSNFPLDFSAFSGPIFVSANSSVKMDVIRGQIYSNAKYPAFGIAKIVDDDFSPLIEYALKSEGFEDSSHFSDITIGYSPFEINKKIKDIIFKLDNNEIEKIFVIGLVNKFNNHNEYVENFIKESPTNAYIISFAKGHSKHNLWNVNSYLDFSILYYIIENFKENKVDITNKMSIFIADCNSSTISHLFNLIHLNIENIFLGPCCPNIINPVLFDGLSDIFKIKSFTNPYDDIHSSKKEEE